MTQISHLSVKQATELDKLAEELQQYPKKRGQKKRFLPPELKTRIGKVISTLPEDIPATIPARILGLSPSRVRMWANGKGTGSVGGDKVPRVEKQSGKVYASESTGFGLTEYARIHSKLLDAVSAKPGEKAMLLVSAMHDLAAATTEELSTH